MFLLAASTPLPLARPTWVLRDESEQSRFFVDADRWDRRGDVLRIWLKTEPKEVQATAYRDYETLEEVQCTPMQSRTVQAVFNLRDGSVRSGRRDMPFATTEPGTAWHEIAAEACAMTAEHKVAHRQ